LLLAVMLLGAINYNNSLAHFLTFLLASVGLVNMVATHRNLSGLQVRKGEASPVHAGSPALFPVAVDNATRSPRYALSLRLPAQPIVAVDVPASASTWVALTADAPSRGRLRPGPVHLSTRFPLGLFRAWCSADLGLDCIIYPRPAPPLPLPENLATPAGDAPGHRVEEGDFSGLRQYRSGDPARRIHWKASARCSDLLIKEFAVPQARGIWLDGDLLQGVDMEMGLSRMCRWILDSDAAGIPYGLRLGSTVIPLDLGEHHRVRCLQTLALFSRPGDA
jgi:uncharacterized protein (DUF58 family)